MESTRARFLDIVIPTCGRNKLLYGCLESLLENKKKSDFHVVIFNNTENGEKIDLSKFLDAGLQIEFYQSKKFLPIDLSMMSSFEHSKSKYVLWLGDDDRIVPCGVDMIIDYLQSSCPDLLVLNKGYKSDDDQIIIPRKNMNDDMVYHRPDVFFDEWVFDLPFGSFVCTKNSEAFTEAKEYVGTSHAYSAFLFIMLSNIFKLKKDINIIVTKQAISYSIDCKKSWVLESSDILLNHIPLWFKKLNKLYEKEAEKALAIYFKSITPLGSLFRMALANPLPVNNYYQSYLPKWKIYLYHWAARNKRTARIVLHIKKYINQLCRI